MQWLIPLAPALQEPCWWAPRLAGVLPWHGKFPQSAFITWKGTYLRRCWKPRLLNFHFLHYWYRVAIQCWLMSRLRGNTTFWVKLSTMPPEKPSTKQPNSSDSDTLEAPP